AVDAAVLHVAGEDLAVGAVPGDVSDPRAVVGEIEEDRGGAGDVGELVDGSGGAPSEGADRVVVVIDAGVRHVDVPLVVEGDAEDGTKIAPGPAWIMVPEVRRIPVGVLGRGEEVFDVENGHREQRGRLQDVGGHDDDLPGEGRVGGVGKERLGPT